jgi:hypothetical protein
MADPAAALRPVCEGLGIDPDDSALQEVSWNGQRLDEVYPWGTIRAPTPEANLATAQELSNAERDEVGARAKPFLEPFGYEQFLAG